MSNKETLQGYNETLNQYNTNLDDILNTINNLPENENLTEELDTYNNEVTEQEATINTILKTLQTKAIGGGGSMNNYSTEETVIGTWIDGKPLYRKVIFIETLGKGVDLLKSHNIENSDAIWINESASFLSNVNEALGVNWFFSTSDWVRTWINKDNGSIRMKSPSNLSTLSAYITLEYTKKTD